MDRTIIGLKRQIEIARRNDTAVKRFGLVSGVECLCGHFGDCGHHVVFHLTGCMCRPAQQRQQRSWRSGYVKSIVERLQFLDIVANLAGSAQE